MDNNFNEITTKITEYLDSKGVQIFDITNDLGIVEYGVQIGIQEMETEYYVTLSHSKANMAFGVDKNQGENDPDIITCLDLYSESYKGL